jgi:exosortase C (VPDSG-CTERM-specific)
VAALTLLFARPLTALALYSAHSDLHSYILLIPFLCCYLIYVRGAPLSVPYRRSIGATIAPVVLGLAALLARLHWSGDLSGNDGLSLMALAFVSLIAAGGFLFLGAEWMNVNAFPVGFLLFLVPLPDAAVNWLENASVLASADATALYFRFWGIAVARHGTIFELPGITLQVAQECSGIRSSWILVITGLLASHLFLRSRWRRFVLVAFVIPLGIVRNGLRIFVIAWLCVNVGPEMIDSPIHHHGGPAFFALSLIPLFLLLWWLRHQERRPNAATLKPGRQAARAIAEV